jgi:hypothetical protein
MYKGIEFLSAIAERLLNTEMPRLGKRGVNPGGILSTHEVATILGLSHPTLLRLLKEEDSRTTTGGQRAAMEQFGCDACPTGGSTTSG